MIYIALGLAVICITCFILVEISQKPLYAFFLKGFASFGFLFVFFVGLYQRFYQDFSIFDLSSLKPLLVIIVLLGSGLVAGLLGDLYLALRPLRPKSEDQIIILSGITCFSIGHIFYFTALVILGNFSIIAVLISILATIGVYVMSQLMKFKMGVAKWPTMFYSLLIFLMTGQALVNGFDKNFQSQSLLLLCGAILFSISDLLLAPIYFKNVQSKSVIALNLVTYYGAQLCIALSIIFL